MANADVVAYNIAVFISTLYLLEFGADKFVDHTAIVARRTNIPETIIALVTAGAEWEELAVVVASLARGRSSLAMGNIIGSAISNIIGAFPLGLLFFNRSTHVRFDRSSKIYSLLLLLLTTFVAPVTYFSKRLVWLVSGSVLLAIFGIYLGSVGWAISRGRLIAPEDSDDSSSSGEDNTDDNADLAHNAAAARSDVDRAELAAPTSSPPTHRRPRGLTYHISHLLLGFLSICLAGYILSKSATNITDEFHISDVLFGVIILAIATTLPEKFIAVMSGHRGRPGILVANTAGSNIFLLSLCLGIIMVDTAGKFDNGNVKIAEICILWGSTIAFTTTVWFGRKYCRWIGVVMLVAYLAFIVLEFTVIHLRPQV